jgi:UDP-N-acetylmuramate--alanine ligase
MCTHFIGLGGIGMSALARVLLQKGEAVQGSDLHGSPLLENLKKEGAKVHVGHHEDHLGLATKVVYSSDIKEDNVEFCLAKEKKLPLLHRSELLHELMKGKTTCLVAGSHGKTTTTALLSAVLLEANLDPSFVVGGLIRSLNTNGRGGRGAYFVAEADESDGSFLKTAADYAILTNIGNDHLSYWGSERILDLAFEQFIAQTQHLIWCADDPKLAKLNPKGISYGFSPQAKFQITHFRQTHEGIYFDLGPHKNIFLNLMGRHNALNGSAVFALALQLQVPEEAIRSAFRQFSGTARRLEWKGEAHKVQLYDDYGHHPTEIKATLEALRQHVGEKRLVVAFQPHRYTRVRDLFADFARCFDAADLVYMTDIYSAGETPLEGITSASLYTFLREKLGSKIHFLPRTHLEAGLAAILKPLDVVLTIGAGDITKAGGPILELFAKRAPKLKIALLCGGSSAEHEVSLMSCANIQKALDPSVYEVETFCIPKERASWPLEKLSQVDCAIPVFHGPQGEDGMVAALLTALSIPYVGCDYRSGAICMQKSWSKYVAICNGVATAPFIEADANYRIQQIEEKIPYPIWVKPAHLGSSIGVTRTTNRDELIAAAELALKLDDVILFEQEIQGRQIEFSLLGNKQIRFALPAEIINEGDFVAYDKKYGATAMEIAVPARITETEKKIGYELAETIYRACNCRGLARVDFFLDERGIFWFNEINPFPGFTDTSAYPKAWKGTGLSTDRLIDELIALALYARQA